MKTNCLMVLCASLLFGCSDMGRSEAELKNLTPKETNEPVYEDPPYVETPPDAPRCETGTSYVGIGGMQLEVGRADEEQGWDRDRVKPYAALIGEFERVLGRVAPDHPRTRLLLSLGPTFGSVPEGWYVEPELNAVSLYSAMRVAFIGCLDLTATGSEYEPAPTYENAPNVCRAFARRFWSRSPAADELSACVQVAVEGSAKETNPRRRWAYTCASVLTSAPFLTY